MAKADVTAARLRELFTYDPTTGGFLRLVTVSNNARAGTIAGHRQVGYLATHIAKRLYLCHRLAWLYMTGEWPTHTIDHIDGNRTNNAWSNLRDVAHRTNIQNERKARRNNLASGLLGVSRNGKRWSASIRVGGVNAMYLGTFDTPEEAHAVYLAAKRIHHAGCTI